MKLQRYLIEGRTQSLPKDEFEKLLRTDYRDSVMSVINGKGMLFRGNKDTPQYGYVDTSKGKLRRSANTSNEYTLCIDNSSRWKNYPRRGRSLICSTSLLYAINYGHLNIVLPINGSSIGICSDDDFWYSFPYIEKVLHIRDMDSFNSEFRDLLRWGTGNRTNDKNWAQLRSAMKEFDKKFENYNYDWDNVFSEIYSGINYTKSASAWDDAWKGSLQKTINDIIDPVNNEFKLVNIGDQFDDDCEAWFSGKSLVINTNYFGDKGEYEKTLNYLMSVMEGH